MSSNRRSHSNYALERAIQWSQQLACPLVILDILPSDYPFASDRHHRFQLEGMADLAAEFKKTAVLYYPFLESECDAGNALLHSMSELARIVIADDYPLRYAHSRLERIETLAKVRVEAVDSNGLLPLSISPQAFPTAYAFRRFLQKSLRPYLLEFPAENPLKGVKLPAIGSGLIEIERKWPRVEFSGNTEIRRSLDSLPIRREVKPVLQKGGQRQASKLLDHFLNEKLDHYSANRNEPELDATSRLSLYLHCGFISTHDIVRAILDREDWSLDRLGTTAKGQREGWWGVRESVEAFLDQLVTWRELGFNFCRFRDDYDQFSSLPLWARQTLAAHKKDKREFRYTGRELETGATHDQLWNAAQGQLIREGYIHNYLRMLWGKKIIEWTPTPEEALAIMLELNDKYALDGSDPNSYSGIFWTLGRYDRPWGPERAIFGTIRYMSSANTARKVRVKDYISRYAPQKVSIQ